MRIKPDREIALLFTKRALSEIICDTVNLEGVPFTLPEVQTLMDGVTVGGHKISDQQMVLNQQQAWYALFNLVEHDAFTVTEDIARGLHRHVGYDLIPQVGQFRTKQVFLSGVSYVPPAADELEWRFGEFKKSLLAMDEDNKSIIDQAIHIFCQMTRIQYFMDGNKRTARLMMAGLLLRNGYPAINVPYRRMQAYNEALLTFYEAGDEFSLNDFFKSCIDERMIKAMQ